MLEKIENINKLSSKEFNSLLETIKTTSPEEREKFVNEIIENLSDDELRKANASKILRIFREDLQNLSAKIFAEKKYNLILLDNDRNGSTVLIADKDETSIRLGIAQIFKNSNKKIEQIEVIKTDELHGLIKVILPFEAEFKYILKEKINIQ